MTNEGLRRVEILRRVGTGGLGLKSAAEMMGVSYRQAKRYSAASVARAHRGGKFEKRSNWSKVTAGYCGIKTGAIASTSTQLNRKVTIAGHSSLEMAPKTLKSVLEQAGLKQR